LEVLAIVLVLALLCAFVIPWVNLFRLNGANERIEALQKEVRNLKRVLEHLTREPADHSQYEVQPRPEVKTDKKPAPKEEAPAPVEAPASVPAAAASPGVRYEEFDEFPRGGATKKTAKPKKQYNSFYEWFEANMGAKLPVWIGGIALILAGFYLVKYSIDAGLLTPLARVMLGGVFGAALLGAGHYINLRPDHERLRKICQSLSGAGLVVLYFVLYSATEVHEFLSPLMGFIGMAGVTVIGALLSLKHGQAVAVFALVGGLLTPVMIQTGDPNPAALFSYLLVLFTGLMFVMSMMGWWMLALFALFGMYGWALLWLLFFMGSYGSGILVFYILGLVVVSVVFTRQYVAGTIASGSGEEWGLAFPTQHVMNIFAIAGGLVLLLIVQQKVELGLFEWSLLGLLSVALMGLSFFKPAIYQWALWAKIAVVLGLLFFWMEHQSFADQLSVLCGFAAVYILIPQWLLKKVSDPRSWAWVQVLTTPLLLVIAYLQMDLPLVYDQVFAGRFWGILGLLLAVASAAQANMIARSYKADEAIRDHLVGVYALASTAFLSLGLTFEIPFEYLALAFAAEIAAVMWIIQSVRIDFMQKIISGLLGVFALLNLKQILLFAGVIVESLWGETMSTSFVQRVQLSDPIVMLGGSAGFLALALYLNRENRELWAARANASLVYVLSLVVLSLIYYLIKFVYFGEMFSVQSGFMLRGVITLSISALGLVAFNASKRWDGPTLRRAGEWMFHLAMLRVFWFDMVIHNPLGDGSQNVLEPILLNGVTMTYGATLVLSALFIRLFLQGVDRPMLHKVYNVWLFVLVLSLVNLTVRQYFHGANLAAGVTGNAEIYTYSVVWLLLGIGLLVAGVKKGSQALRVSSLALMLITVAKVFLYDAAELEGLLRVFSFLGLGVSLIGLSFFYTRYVFADNAAQKES